MNFQKFYFCHISSYCSVVQTLSLSIQESLPTFLAMQSVYAERVLVGGHTPCDVMKGADEAFVPSSEASQPLSYCRLRSVEGPIKQEAKSHRVCWQAINRGLNTLFRYRFCLWNSFFNFLCDTGIRCDPTKHRQSVGAAWC